MTGWNSTDNDSSNPAGTDTEQPRVAPNERVSILIAAPPEKVSPLTKTFSADARFSLAAVATSVEDVRVKLAVRPEVVLAQADTASSFEDFSKVLSNFVAAISLPFFQKAPRHP